MQQQIHCVKQPIRAKISIPGSKNISERALLMAALADGVSEITALNIDQETKSFINALYQLGIVIQLDENNHSAIIAGCNGKFPKKQATIWCANEVLLHFLLCATASTPGVYFFDGPKELKEKSLQDVLNVLCRQGAQIIPSDKYSLPFTLVGADSLEGGDVILDSAITNKLISSLLMIAPYARTAFNFTLLDLKSEPHVEMTCGMMAEFGVLVHRVHQGQFMIPVPQRYQAQDYAIEPDLSYGGYFFGAAALTGGELTIQPTIISQLKQSQANIFPILQKMGCKIEENYHGLTIKGQRDLQGVEVKLKSFSDIFATLCAIAPFAKTPTHIIHSGQLDATEEKRLNAFKQMMTRMDIKFKAGANWLTIFPSSPKGMSVNPIDLNMAMSAAIIGLKIPNVTIENKGIIDSTYPQFFPTLNNLSASVATPL